MNKSEIVEDFYFNFPSSVAILGSSFCGKTQMLARILTRLDEVCSSYLPVSKLVLCFDTYQKIYDTIIEHLENQFPGIEVLTFSYYPEKEMEDPSFFNVPPGTMMVIIFDDLSHSIKPSFETIMRKSVHHNSICCFLLSQESSGDPAVVKRSLRSVQYLIIMRNSQPGIFLTDISKKYLPGNKQFLFNCFEMASKTNSPFYPYLIVQPNSFDNKVRCGIFREETGYIYRLP